MDEPHSYDSNDVDLATLVARSAVGDHFAFAEMYRRTHYQVFRSVLRTVRYADPAADVTQEVYVQAWSQADRYDVAAGSVLGWLTTIARRRAIDRIRARTRAVAREEAYGHAHRLFEVDEVWERVVAHLDVIEPR